MRTKKDCAAVDQGDGDCGDFDGLNYYQRFCFVLTPFPALKGIRGTFFR